MKTNSMKTNVRIWFCVAIAALFLIHAQAAMAQWTNGTNINNTNTGNVGIGTSSPQQPLQVQHSVDGWEAQFGRTSSVHVNVSGNQVQGLDGSGNGSPLYLNYSLGGNIYTVSGNVGIGTITPGTLLHLYKASDPSLNIQTGGGNYSYLQLTTPASGNGYLIKNTAAANSVLNKSLYLYNSDGPIQFVPAGDPAKALTVDTSGNVSVSGTINAKYQDVAEWVPSSEKLAAGTVVVLDQTKSNQVIASSSAYDTRVAGVISSQSGITLGEKSDSKVLVATTGRVRVKVDASRGPIAIGDLLVTSDVPGVAMKSIPVEFAGRKMHMPGTIIGKALEPLAKGKGEILVLLSLQ